MPYSGIWRHSTQSPPWKHQSLHIFEMLSIGWSWIAQNEGARNRLRYATPRIHAYLRMDSETPKGLLTHDAPLQQTSSDTHAVSPCFSSYYIWIITITVKVKLSWASVIKHYAMKQSQSQSHMTGRQSVGQSVMVSGAHLGPATNCYFSLRFSFRQLRFVIL
jgi:hypothetical protein